MSERLNKSIVFCRRLLLFLPILLSALLVGGCVKLALRLSPSVFDDMSVTFFQECDPELARDALPAQLKLGEALLREDPGNKKLLTSLCSGYGGYALLFVEERDPQRASHLYYRALVYGLRAMGIAQGTEGTVSGSKFAGKIRKTDLPAGFWTSVSWLRWIGLNMDNPAALAQMPEAVSLLKAVVRADPSYFYGAPCAIMGSVLASRPPALGGSLSSAQTLFQKALHINKGRLYLIPFLYARYYAVAKQDRRLFQTLLRRIIEGSPRIEPRVCLINQVIKQRAKNLLENMDEFFI